MDIEQELHECNWETVERLLSRNLFSVEQVDAALEVGVLSPVAGDLNDLLSLGLLD